MRDHVRLGRLLTEVDIEGRLLVEPGVLDRTALLAGGSLLVVVALFDVLGMPLRWQIGLATTTGVAALAATAFVRQASSRVALLLMTGVALVLACLRLDRLNPGPAATVLALLALVLVAVSGLRAAAFRDQRLGLIRRELKAQLHGQERERRRLARDLHDGPLQELAGARLLLVGALGGDERTLRTAVAAVTDLLDTQVTALRHTIVDLRPAVLDGPGLVSALRALVDRLNSTGDARVRAEVDRRYRRLPADEEETLYRVAQEALTNALKHTSATCVLVRLTTDDDGTVTLEVIDDGTGSGTTPRAADGGLGLVGMAERAELIGAQLSVTAGPGGTVVRLSLAASSREAGRVSRRPA